MAAGLFAGLFVGFAVRFFVQAGGVLAAGGQARLAFAPEGARGGGGAGGA